MTRFRRPFATLLVAGLTATAVPLFLAPRAEACATLAAVRTTVVAPTPGSRTGIVDQATERFLFIRDGEKTTAHLQVQYYGDASDFSLIVPAPAEPTVGIGSNALFTALREATRPRFELTHRTEGTCKTLPSGGSVQGAPSSSRAAAPQANAGVSVVSQGLVGPYATTVIKAEDAGALRTWLTENQYAVPAKLDDALSTYVSGGAYFVALKLQAGRGTGDLVPVTLTYTADKAALPVRLASLSAVPDMDVFVWVLGNARAVPDNYDHVEINEARIDWFREGRNYRQVVTEAMNEAEAGKAFVTDYAGPSSVVKPGSAITRVAALDPSQLATSTTAGGFAASVRSAGYFESDAELAAFLRRHVQRDPQAAPATSDDAAFFTALANGSNPLGADTAFDPATAITELTDSVVGPAKGIVKAFAGLPYLTQLYTTISPEEMVLDPTFVFNTQMEKVSNVHKAEAIKVCDANTFTTDAPTKIKLASGETYMLSEGQISDSRVAPATGGGTKATRFPATRIRMRCGGGSPQMLKSNGNAIASFLSDLATKGLSLRINTAFPGSPLDGAGATIALTIPFAGQLAGVVGSVGNFGCAGCSASNAPPVAAGSGEFGSYALVFMGLLGYRRWSGRRPH